MTNTAQFKIELVLLLNLVVVTAGLYGEVTSAKEQARRQREFKELMRERQSADRYTNELKTAWNYFSALNMKQAVEVFEGVLAAEDAGERDKIQALYGLGLSYRYDQPKENKPKARGYFNEIVTQYPQNSLAAWALMELGAMENVYTEGGRLAARKFYRRLLKNYPDSLAVHETALRLADTYLGKTLDSAEIQKGLSILENHIGKYPDNPLVGSMHYRVGYFYFACWQDYEKSLPHSVATSTLRMEDPYRWPEDYWHTAMNFMRLNRLEEAIPWFKKIYKERPMAREAHPAREMVARIRQYLERIKSGKSSAAGSDEHKTNTEQIMP